MKKITLIVACLGLISLTSCKKDRDCECTTTYTSGNGTTTTSAPETITFVKMKKGDAKTICQKTTQVNVNESGSTTTTVNDCKLK